MDFRKRFEVNPKNAQKYAASGLGPGRLHAPRTVFIDVTGIATEPIFTGIQRIARLNAEAAGNHAVLIYFDASRNAFHELRRLPKLLTRDERAFTRFFRRLAKNAVESGRAKLVGSGLGNLVPTFLKNWVWGFYSRHLLDQVVESARKLSQGAVKISPDSTLVVVEIPRGRRHLQALAGVASIVSDFRIYVHDLIPFLRPEFFDLSFRESTRGHFLEYLQLVLSAGRVFCNSATTKSDYQKFANLFPRSNQRVEVLLPMAPEPLISVDSRPPRESFLTRLESLRPQGGLKETRVLLIGNLGKRKNFEVVVRAVFNGVARGKPIKLLVVASPGRDLAPGLAEAFGGASPRQRETVNIFSELRESELQALFEFATVFAWPSISEGFGLPIIEAVQKGCPVVALQNEVNHELSQLFDIKLVDSQDPLEWLNALCAEKASKSGSAGQRSVDAQLPSASDFFRTLSLP